MAPGPKSLIRLDGVVRCVCANQQVCDCAKKSRKSEMEWHVHKFKSSHACRKKLKLQVALRYWGGQQSLVSACCGRSGSAVDPV